MWSVFRVVSVQGRRKCSVSVVSAALMSSWNAAGVRKLFSPRNEACEDHTSEPCGFTQLN